MMYTEEDFLCMGCGCNKDICRCEDLKWKKDSDSIFIAISTSAIDSFEEAKVVVLS